MRGIFLMLAGKHSWRIAALSLVVLFGAIAAMANEQAQKRKTEDAPSSGPTPLYFGVEACQECHSKNNRNEARGGRAILCECNEATIWRTHDKHKDAYTNLFEERGKQMIRLLGYKPEQIQINCVSCHGVNTKVGSEIDPTFKIDDGVSCGACHGFNAEWVPAHHGSGLPSKRKEWHEKSREEKESKYGMTDLWDPAKRATLCASCHVGDAPKCRVVTHEMYAAGHPPLPGVEVATFSKAMPKHWEYLSEKSADVQKLLGYDPKELERTKLVVIGGAVDLEAAMNLLADQAEKTATAREPLDLAQLDCYACHHELRRPSWRQQRGYLGQPGRPQFRPWPLALVRLGLRHLKDEAGEGQLDAKMEALHRAFDAQPLGKSSAVAPAARAVANWAGQLAKRLEGKDVAYDPAAAQRLLESLVQMAASEEPDYDSARQIAWAFQTIYGELHPKGPANQPLQDLDRELKLDLPSGQTRQIMAELPQALERIADYDPHRFQSLFSQLGKNLKR